MRRKDRKKLDFNATAKVGLIAENKAEADCLAAGIPYIKGTATDQEYGIDFYYGENLTAVDCKNTFSIYVGNGFAGDIFQVRQPFRINCKAEEYWIMNRITSEWIYKGPISDYLTENFFINKICLRLAKVYLQSLEKQKRVCDVILFGEIKNKLKSLTRNDVHISYDQVNEGWVIKMKTYAINKYLKAKGISIFK
jgi:hypothetical protein